MTAIELAYKILKIHRSTMQAQRWSTNDKGSLVGEIVDAYGVPADAVKHEIAPESVVFPKEEVK